MRVFLDCRIRVSRTEPYTRLQTPSGGFRNQTCLPVSFPRAPLATLCIDMPSETPTFMDDLDLLEIGHSCSDLPNHTAVGSHLSDAPNDMHSRLPLLTLCGVAEDRWPGTVLPYMRALSSVSGSEMPTVNL